MNQKNEGLRGSLLTFCKGMVVGGTMLVPGVSGGSMAMILGVYDRLVSSVSSFFKHKRESFLFLVTFALGGGVGALLFANPLSKLIELWRMPMLYFFIGAVAGCVPMIFREAKVARFHWKQPVYVLVGVLIVSALSLLPSGLVADSEMQAGAVSFLLLMAAGFIAAVALVLPGISVSYLLLMLGLYDETMKAIGDLYFPFLIPLGLGLALGVDPDHQDPRDGDEPVSPGDLPHYPRVHAGVGGRDLPRDPVGMGLALLPAHAGGRVCGDLADFPAGSEKQRREGCRNCG